MIPNWPLLNLHKIIRNNMDQFNVKSHALYPSQKYSVCGKHHGDRKKSSVETGIKLLRIIGQDDFLAKLETYERQHDITDAILMIEYYRIKKHTVTKSKNKS